MRIFRRWSVILCCILLAGVTHPSLAQSSKQGSKKVRWLVIGPLKDQSLVKECGCQLYALNGDPRDVFVYQKIDNYNRSSVWLNIDGVDREFEFLKTTRPKSKALGKGGRFIQIFSDGNTRVGITYTITRPCVSEGCEEEGVDVRVDVIDGKRRATVKLTGACGCG